MKNLKIFFTAVIALVVWGGNRPVIAENLEPAEVLKSIFLGQAYETVDLYLLGIRGEDDRVNWPVTVVARSMEPFIKGLDLTAGVVDVVNGPRLEAWERDGEVSAEDASGEPPAPPQPIGFFETVLDSTVDDGPIGFYAVTGGTVAAPYPVVAFDPYLKLGPLDFSVAKSTRPLTKSEAGAVKQAKRAAERASKDQDCTTEPGFLDGAQQLWTAPLQGVDLWIRVSQYSNAGCAGHLAINYVIDVMKGKEPVATGEIQHYYGAI